MSAFINVTRRETAACRIGHNLTVLCCYEVSLRYVMSHCFTHTHTHTSLPSFKRQNIFIYQIFPITLNCFLIFVYRVLEAT